MWRRTRNSAGLNAAKTRWVKLGRPVKIDAHCEDLAKLRAQGLTGRAIAKELSIPSSNVFKNYRAAWKPCGLGGDFKLIGKGGMCAGDAMPCAGEELACAMVRGDDREAVLV